MAKRHRRERVEDLLLEVVSEVFRKLKDPGIPSEGLVSFMKVEVANDLGYADVSYSYLGDDSKLEDLQNALDRSKGFFRREINKVVRLRKIPELRFQLNRSMEKGSEILTLLEKVRAEDAKLPGAEEAN
ncbi:MAG: 30S ribosome-binding factor RbfA [Vulcanimicrobiota bacterium]